MDDELTLDSMFPEPPRPKTPPPTTQIYKRGDGGKPLFESESLKSYASTSPISTVQDWESIEIRLVGDNPLWGHYLWNAAKSLACFMDKYPALYLDKNVLELGAAGALPSIVAAKNGARKVVVTDYPDAPLIENIEHNVARNVEKEDLGRVVSMGHIWGHSASPLLEHIRLSSHAPESDIRFDLIILSDLIFNHSQHNALLDTCENTIDRTDPSSTVLVFYTHHRPHLAHRDLNFFELAKERGWDCEEVIRERFEPMFPEDPGAEEVRATVHGWVLKLAKP